jgi:putative phosphoesterase
MIEKPLDFLVLSDTHGRSSRLHQVAKAINFRPVAILFLGDGLRDLEVLSEIPSLRDIPVVAVQGNCDTFFSLRGDESPTRLLTYGKHKIFMTHGHRYGVRGGVEAAAQNAIAAGADVLLYGHTHVATEYQMCVQDRDGVEQTLLIANPGSLGEPRDGGPPRFGVLTLTEDAALFGHGSIRG